MSKNYEINIPKAFKLKKPNQIWGYLAQIREQVIYEMQNSLEAVYKNLLSSRESVAFLKELFKIENNVTPEHCSKYVKLLCFNKDFTNNNPTQRSLYNINTSVRVIFHDKNFYLIPSCNGIFEKVFDFMLLEKDLDEYSFNTMRKSPRVHQDDWDERGKIWTEILYGSDSFELSLQFPIMTSDNEMAYNYIDPFMEEARKNWPKKRKRIDEVIQPQKKSFAKTSATSAANTNQQVVASPPPIPNNVSTAKKPATPNSPPRKRNISGSSVVYPSSNDEMMDMQSNGLIVSVPSLNKD
jgi:hypothetical protein